MMTPDELRALADALDSPASGMTTAAAAAYLRAYAATPAAPQAEPKHEEQPLRDLLAIIHCDGGHHTGAVGIKQSITDALAAVTKMKYKLAMAKREPLTVSRILDIEADAIRQWRDNGRIIEFTVVFARMIERTHGIGGDDAE